MPYLKEVLVVTTKKGFWSTDYSKKFPNIIYTPHFSRSSSNFLNAIPLYLVAVYKIISLKPKLVFVGPAGQTGLMLALTKKLLRLRFKIIFAQPGLQSYVQEQVDRCIVWETESLTKSYTSMRKVFFPIPLIGNFERDTEPADNPQYIFSGGGTLRDYPTLLRAVSKLEIKVVIVAHNKNKLEWADPLPNNVFVYFGLPREKYLELIAKSLFVVLPLKNAPLSSGATSIVESMGLGKCVITNDLPASRDYIENSVDGIMIPPGDETALRETIIDVIHDANKRQKISRRALERSKFRTPEKYFKFLKQLCEEVCCE